MEIENVIVSLPFKGTIMTWLDKTGKPVYTKFNSFDEYKTAEEKHGTELVLMSFDQYNIMYNAYWKRDFSPITETQYYQMLECLPPCRWHWINDTINVFFCSEAMIGLFHSCYIDDTTTGVHKYACALISIISTDSEILTHYAKVKN